MRELKRRLTTTQLLLITFGGTMGSGWLLSPFYAAKLAGPFAPLSWVIGALMISTIILCFIELVTLYPDPGSMTRFGRRTHGRLIGGLYGLFLWLSLVSFPPVETSAILQYSANTWPSLGLSHQDGFSLTHLGLMAAAVILLLMVTLNILAIQWFARISNLLVVFKLMIPISVIVLLLSSAFHKSNFLVSLNTNPEFLSNIMKALPLGGVIYGYMGFSVALQLAGEVKKPEKALPIALLGTCFLACLIYFLLQVSFIGAYRPNALNEGWQAISFSAASGPFLVLFKQLSLNWFFPFIVIASFLSPFIAGIIGFSAGARTLFALSEDKVFPKGLMLINKNGIPFRAIVFNFIIGFALLLPLPGWDKLLGLLVSLTAFVYSLGPISMGTLRLTHRELERPFKLKGAHFIALLAMISVNRIIFWSGEQTVYILTGLVFAFYFIALAMFIEKEQRMRELKSSIWVLFYVLGLSTIVYLKEAFSLPHQKEYALVLMLSLTVYLFALFCGKMRVSFRDTDTLSPDLGDKFVR